VALCEPEGCVFHKLHERDAAKPRLVRGLSCDQAGVFFGGDCALVEALAVKGRTVYRVRAIGEINKALSVGFGAEVDLSRHLPTLERVADLMTEGCWGLAQITALQMRMPELADDDAVERLLKADDLLRFNPYHKPPGLEGGQFTSAGDVGGGADQSGGGGQAAHGTAAGAVPQLSYRTTSGGPDTPFWGIKFELSSPTTKGGYIIQQIEGRYEIDPPGSKLMVADRTYWDAFQVNPGSTHTIYFEKPNADGAKPIGGGDDVWMGQVGQENSHGVQIDIGTARFYEGLTAADLTRLGFAVGNVPGQGLTLQNTYNDPRLPTANASNAIVRISRNRF
jgi:hypothetical protein